MSGKQTAAELAYLTRALKAPTLRDAVPGLAERARDEAWTFEEFLAACLEREVNARNTHGGEGRIRAARFPARKSLDEFDFTHAGSLNRDQITHLAGLDFLTEKRNIVLLGPPGTGKTHLATAIGIRACQAGHRTAFATATQWVDRLAQAHTLGALQDERRYARALTVTDAETAGFTPRRWMAASKASVSSDEAAPQWASARSFVFQRVKPTS